MKPTSQKRAEALERQAEYDKLTTEQKLARAASRGHAGTRESKRLRKELGR